MTPKPLESGCQDHKYCCKTCEDYTEKGSCMFLTRLCESQFLTPVEKWVYNNEEGIFMNAADRDLIGCLGCLSHSSLRGKLKWGGYCGQKPISSNDTDTFLCCNDVHKDLCKRERERVLKIAMGLIKHEGFLDIAYDDPVVLISDIERAFDVIKLVDDKS